MRVDPVTIFKCLLVLLTGFVLVSQQTTCPEPFSYSSVGFCLFIGNVSVGYCEAHQCCYKMGEDAGGRAFIPGKYYKDRVGYASGLHWTGLHRLSSDNGVRNTAWFVADPYSTGEKIEEKELLPIKNELPEAQILVLRADRSSLYTTLTTEDGVMKTNVLSCQYDGTGKRIYPPAVEMFKRDPSSETHLSTNEVQGCSEADTAETKMACAMRCKKNRACRSFAYHPDTKACVIQKYVHSKLNKDVEPKDGKWELLVRPGW